MFKMKTLAVVALSLVTVSSALYAAPWHHPQMRPEVQMQIDTDAVRANLTDQYASLAKYIGVGEKSRAAYDRYVEARVKASVEHALWHNKNVPNADTRQGLMSWRNAHDQLRTKLNDRVIGLRADLIKTMTPEQVARFDRYEPTSMSGCAMGYGPRGGFTGPGFHGHMRDGHMNPDCQGYQGRRGPGCGW